MEDDGKRHLVPFLAGRFVRIVTTPFPLAPSGPPGIDMALRLAASAPTFGGSVAVPLGRHVSGLRRLTFMPVAVLVDLTAANA